MSKEEKKYLWVKPGTELNYGRYEDSDSVIATEPTILEIVGPRENGALPVRIMDSDRPSDEILYLHQPELSA